MNKTHSRRSPKPSPSLLPAPTFGRYVLGLVYDGLVSLALCFVVVFAAMAIKGPNPNAPAHKRYAFDPVADAEMFNIMPFAVIGVLFAYFAYSWVRGGQTLAMRAWNFDVQNLSGGRINFGQAMMRFAAAWISLLACGLGFAWAVFDSQNRTWHDIISKTRIVQK